MTGLLGPNGKPISSGASFVKKAPSPVLGEAFGQWTGRDTQLMHLPGGGIVQFDLSRLTLADYRVMKYHYQVNSALSLLNFMMHQMDWTIEADDRKVRDHVHENMERIWSRLVRALGQAFWAGFSPNVLQWENEGRRTWVTKIKDLVPEDSRVNWKEVDGAIPPGYPNAVPPKLKIYDGIKQNGVSYPIPQQNTLWYPLLMDNGDYYGSKLLKAAFQPWFFSQLIHLYSNRYFERFGEPLPIGRAPFEDSIALPDGTSVPSNQYIAQQIQNIRSRAVAVLPSDRSTSDGTGKPEYDYDIEYLESQMRGADFERYMTRLDEEISLALFTPLLLVRTGDVGSYSLGSTHTQMYQMQLNALAGDRAEYINKYLIAPMVRFNFPRYTGRVRLNFRKVGVVQAETLRAILAALTAQGAVKYDIEEIGQAAGLSLEEIKVVTKPEGDNTGDDGDDREARVRDDKKVKTDRVEDKVTARISGQATKAYQAGKWDEWRPDIGFSSKLSGEQSAILKGWSDDVLDAHIFEGPDEFVAAFNKVVEAVVSGG